MEPEKLCPWTAVPRGSLCEFASAKRLFVRWPDRARGTADSAWVPSTTGEPSWEHEADNTLRGDVRVVAKDLTSPQCKMLSQAPTAEARLLGPLFERGNTYNDGTAKSSEWTSMPRDSLSIIVYSDGTRDSTGRLVVRGGDTAQFVGTNPGAVTWSVQNHNAQRGRILVLAEELTADEQQAMIKARSTAEVLALRPVRPRPSLAGQWVAWSDVPPGSVVRSSDGREFLCRPQSEGGGQCFELRTTDTIAFQYISVKDPSNGGPSGVYYVVADDLTPARCDHVQAMSWPPARWAYLTHRAEAITPALPRGCLWQDVSSAGDGGGGITSNAPSTPGRADGVLSAEGRFYNYPVRVVVRDVPRSILVEYASVTCRLRYAQLLDKVVRAKWGDPSGWAEQTETVEFLANEIAFRTCSAIPPETYTVCAEAVGTAVESVLCTPGSIRQLDAAYDGGNGNVLSEHSTPSRLLADVGIHVWACGVRYFGWWGTGVRFADSLAELLYCYVREDNGDPIVHATAVLGRDHGYVMRTEAPDAVTRDVRYSDAWQLAEFVGRCRQRLLCGEVQRTPADVGWRDGLLVTRDAASTITCGPWPVRASNEQSDHWTGLFFEYAVNEGLAAKRLRLANAVTNAAHGASRRTHGWGGPGLSWVRRCS